MISYKTFENQSISGYQFKTFQIPHGMFTRQGGSSKKPYSSLNLSYHVGDSAHSVRLNRRAVKKSLGVEFLVSAKQVHGSTIKSMANVIQDIEIAECDALITNQPGVGLLVQQADCQAILLYDPINIAIAAIHCGWRGSVQNIIQKTIGQMAKDFDSKPAQLIAGISPSLGPCCGEFIHFKQELPESMHHYQDTLNHFNFWDISANQLESAGLLKDSISIPDQCTVCNKDFFSYRRTVKRGQQVTGRNGSIIALPSV